jgi:glucose uptake protein GlcU
LIPKGLRPFGIVLFIFGIILTLLKFRFNFKPDFLDFKVFAVYSYYIEAKSFSMITHQMIGEIAGIFLLSGLFLIAFTRENEESEIVDSLRLKAFMITAYLNLFYLLFSILFFFGFGFVGTLTLFTVYWLAVYLVVFRYLLYKNKSKR